jgi:hypothetical protein
VLGLSLEVAKIRPGRKQTYTLSVSSKEDINKIINFFDTHESLKGNKLIQYRDFKSAVSQLAEQ